MLGAPPNTKLRSVEHAQRSDAGDKGLRDQALEDSQRANLRNRLAKRVRSGKGVSRGEELLAASRQWRR